MRKNLTTDEFITRSKLIHNSKYGYHLVKYLNAKTKVIIVCHIHGEFLIFPHAHTCSKMGCPRCSIRGKTTSEFVKECQAVHGDIYDYTDTVFVGVTKPMNVVCRNHGKFNQIADYHRNGNGCPKCAGRFQTTEDIINRAKAVHGDKYDYSKVVYVKALDVLEIKCPIHGQVKQTIHKHLNGSGCPKCGLEQNTLKRSKTTSQFIAEAKAVHGDKYDYSTTVYKNSYIKVSIHCRVHGSFIQMPPSHLGGRGCRRCGIAKSKVEKDWLDSLEIPERQFKVKIGNKKYLVDGYDPSTNTIYEFNGDYWHGNPRIFDPEIKHPLINKTYGQLYQDTIDKENILKKAGFNVISMWENDWRSLHKFCDIKLIG